MTYEFEPIGVIHSCFKEKFGIPRQSGLIPEAFGRLEILPPFNRPEAFRELECFSHIWLTFVFHAAIREQWSPSVRPPRLGGNRRVGVFATRSPFRPNPLGLSVVKLNRIDFSAHQVNLELGGIDLLDQTPVLDIKPYVPYSDAIPDAREGFAPQPAKPSLSIRYSNAAKTFLDTLDADFVRHLHSLLEQILEQDPRPAYLQGSDTRQTFGMRLYDLNIRWRIEDDNLTITEIDSCIRPNNAKPHRYE
ncbi:MAG: tRNA (N6-threonylcarbamoyladenosine(37)-N6)-methyltransferase TrmO [Gammaproteobacteria bacterium]|nr:tRNA (N6-threonylcarbamoyladenosine(37)-N6)-methyltransferase TrmO [Gammaproteobacteria bacterium]